MFEPQAAPDAPKEVVYLILGSLQFSEAHLRVYGHPHLLAVAAAVKAAGIATVMSEVTMVASTYTKLEGAPANQMIRLLEALEDYDDTQNVYSNFDMDAEQMEHAAG